MRLDYLKLLRQLVKERENWIRKRDDAISEISRLSELIRSTTKMLPAQQRSRCEALFERNDNRPAGLTIAIRLCFTAGKNRVAKEWLTPVEVRENLKRGGFNFENYKANPLASIHTTLKRMVPQEVECKIVDGQKYYRLKAVEEWPSALLQPGEWLANHEPLAISHGPRLATFHNLGRKQNRAAPAKAGRKSS